jgi:pimeloyl-[acyl-carrier protein] synthase
VIMGLNLKARLLGRPALLDPMNPAFRQNPYPFYKNLRERDPVHFHPLGVWLITRYADAVKAWSDPRLAHPASAGTPVSKVRSGPFELMRSKIFISRNPPDHTRLKKIFTDIFTKNFIDQLVPRIEQITAELLTRISAEGGMDVITDFARPLPLALISEIIGVPVSDRMMLSDWSTGLAAAMDIAPSPESRRQGIQAAGYFRDYFQTLIDQRRQQPQMDMISRLISVQARDPKFDDDELIANTTLLFLAGHETTVSLVGHGLYLLLRNPDQLSKLRANPSLMGNAVEEFLRFEPPVQFVGRMAAEDISLSGKRIRKGQNVYILIGAINRDPDQFPDPERFDLERSRNGHLTFGHGIHTCIGQYLARTEIAIAIDALLKKFPNLRLESEGPQWNNLMGGRSPVSLKVRFD